MEATHNTSERQGPALDAAAMEAAGLRYIARYMASSAHVRGVLMRRVRRGSHSPEAIAGAIACIDTLIQRWLKAGILNDAHYAGTKAAGLHRNGASARKIVAALMKSSVDKDLVANAISEYDTTETAAPRPGGDLAAAIAFARRRRMGPFRRGDRVEASIDRELAAFARGGFSRSIAHRVLAASDESAAHALLAELSEVKW